jgi:hypothetical protein
MADPVSAMAVISIGSSAAAGGLGAFGAAQKDDAATAMYNYKAGVAQANAAYAQKNVQYALEEGAVKEEQYGLEGAQKVGAIKVAQAASGLDVNTGTARNVVKSEVAGIQQGEGLISYQAAKKAYGFSVESANFQNEAQFDVASGKNTQSAKFFDIGQSLLSGGASVSDKWMKYSQAGVPGFGGSSSGGSSGSGDLGA